MKTLRYTLSFLTPAFMGNAEQNAQWRTPPIKALLRQWWRVAYAAEKNFAVRVDEMRHEEGELFGVADDSDSRKSLVRIRLDHWSVGKLTQWQPSTQNNVTHPEVKTLVGSDLYLGFGPLAHNRDTKRTDLKTNAAIQAGECAHFSLAVPDIHAPRIERALWLMDRFGTLGGRSRNGWGSFTLIPEDTSLVLTGILPQRDWNDTLQLDWPHALGADARGALIWQTAPHNDWGSLMKTLAVLKIGLRTQFTFHSGHNAPVPEARHWLSYPVTNHSVQPWGGNARLPNTLRFKVRKTLDGKLVGAIFHVSHQPPVAFLPDLAAIRSVWSRVHTFLDAPAQNLSRMLE